MTKRKNLSADRLRELFMYDPHTGLFMRKMATTNKVKSTVGMWLTGWPNEYGYVSFRIDGVAWLAHRLAWLYVHGAMPIDGLWIDHKNGNRSDNRIENLRLVTTSENQLNLSATNERSKSKLRGAHWNARLGKYQSEFEKNGKRVYLGLFDTAEAAHIAHKTAKAESGSLSFR